MTLLYIAAAGLFICGSIAVPGRLQLALNQFFAFLISWVMLALEYTTPFVDGFTERIKGVLTAGGMKDHFVQRAVGSCLVFLISLVALLADIDLVVLTLQAIGIVQQDNSFSILHLLGINVSPAELIAMAVIASASAWGIILLDALKVTTFLPNFLFESASKIFSRSVITISVSMIALSLIILITLSFVRWDALNFDPSDAKTVSTVGKDTLFIFVGTSVLSFFTSMLLFVVAIAFIMCFIVILLAIVLVPIFFIHLILRIIQQIVTLAFNFILAVSNLIVGLSAGARGRLQKNGAVNDVQYDPPPAPNNPAIPQNPAGNATPMSLNNEFGNLTGNSALLIDKPINISLADLVMGGKEPYKYSFQATDSKIVEGKISVANLNLTGLKIGSTDASVTITDQQQNNIIYQFNIDVISPNIPPPGINPENKEPIPPASDEEAGFNPLNI